MSHGLRAGPQPGEQAGREQAREGVRLDEADPVQGLGDPEVVGAREQVRHRDAAAPSQPPARLPAGDLHPDGQERAAVQRQFQAPARALAALARGPADERVPGGIGFQIRQHGPDRPGPRGDPDFSAADLHASPPGAGAGGFHDLWHGSRPRAS